MNSYTILNSVRTIIETAGLTVTFDPRIKLVLPCIYLEIDKARIETYSSYGGSLVEHIFITIASLSNKNNINLMTSLTQAETNYKKCVDALLVANNPSQIISFSDEKGYSGFAIDGRDVYGIIGTIIVTYSPS